VAREATRDASELEKYRRQTQEKLVQVLDTLPPDVLEALEKRAQAQLDIEAPSFGSRFMVKLKRDELILHEHLGFSIWPQLLAQLSDRMEADLFTTLMQPCRLEGIEGETLILSAPDPQIKKRLVEGHMGLLEALARGHKKAYRICILARDKSL
jgi:hypothetical protein